MHGGISNDVVELLERNEEGFLFAPPIVTHTKKYTKWFAVLFFMACQKGEPSSNNPYTS